MKLEFDFLGISESRMLKTQSLNTNVSLQNYSIEQNPQEINCRRGYILTRNILTKFALTLSFINQKKLEPNIFIEVILPKKRNLIVGCIYITSMYGYIHVNDHYLNLLLDKLSKEANKTIVLLGGSSTDLLNFDKSIIFCMI